MIIIHVENVFLHFYFFWGKKLENTFIYQGWVKLIKSYSKDIYNVRKDYILNKCCSFELSRIFGGKMVHDCFQH